MSRHKKLDLTLAAIAGWCSAGILSVPLLLINGQPESALGVMAMSLAAWFMFYWLIRKEPWHS